MPRVPERCQSCEYSFDGLAPTDGSVRCPECGGQTPLLPDPAPEVPREPPPWPSNIVVLFELVGLTVLAGVVCIDSLDSWWVLGVTSLGSPLIVAHMLIADRVPQDRRWSEWKRLVRVGLPLSLSLAAAMFAIALWRYNQDW